MKNKIYITGYRILIVFGLLLVVIPTLAQTGSKNYIYVQEPKEPVSSVNSGTDAIRSVQYFDGLGRPEQSISIKAGPGNQDWIVPVEYDDFGRQVLDYLPVPVEGNNGEFNSDFSQEAEDYYSQFRNYHNEPIIWFSEKTIENSPLNRVMKQAAPGNVWAKDNGHEIEFEYNSNDRWDVRIFKVNLLQDYEPELVMVDDAYQENTLYKTITTDENGNQIQEFKDKQGRVLLKRSFVDNNQVADGVQNSNPTLSRADTYYVYDIYGNLTFVIPPLAVNQLNPKFPVDMEILNELCYQYQYDEKNRLIAKKLPGKEWEYMVYDRQDRLVATQDANLRNQNKWLFTKYDQFSRVVYTGITTGSRNTIQSQAKNAPNNNNESRSWGGFSKNGITVYYTKDAFPTIISEVLTVNYYDNYINLGFNVPSSIMGETELRKTASETKGMATASYIRILGTNSWEKTFTVYDKKSRPVGTYKTNHLGGYTNVESKLSFRGLPEETHTIHKRNAQGIEISITDYFEYDHQERLISHVQQTGNESPQVIAVNTYDELGQLKNKKLGGNSVQNIESQRWQSVDYTYNIRGWLTNINNVDDTMGGNHQPPGSTNDDLFSFKILYYEPFRDGQANRTPKLYNGNISQTFWKTGSDNVLRGYNYGYDNLNRLRMAYFFNREVNPFTGAYDEYIAYDLNGNIQELRRFTGDSNGALIDMDKLTYSYRQGNGNSNVLLNVSDAVSNANTDGFLDGNSNPNLDDYEYDQNDFRVKDFEKVFCEETERSSMTKDRNKGIENITYNHLNLPVQISMGGNQQIQYQYNAAGEKVRKTVFFPNGTVKPVDYLDGFQYAGDILQFFPHPEGYVDAVPLTMGNNVMGYRLKYVYNYTDHLGNIRLSYTKDPQNGTLEIMDENHYFPFGLKHTVYVERNKRGFELKMEGGAEFIRTRLVQETDYQYKYNGKEWQDELGLNMYAMDMRQYDPAIGRWVVQDPIVHFNQSPYSGFDGNPVFWADPSGADGEHYNWDKERYEDSNGNEVSFEEAMASQGLNSDGTDRSNPPDDHFDKNGNYMYSDNRITNNIIIHPFLSKPGSFPYSSSDFNYEVQLKDYYFTPENFNVLLSILNFYGPMVGVFPENLQNESFSIAGFYETKVEGGLSYGKYKFYNNEKGSYHKYALGTGGNGRVTVMLRNGRISSLINDKFNLQLFLYHEGGAGGHLGMPNANHATIYRNQIEHPLFKLTTPDFKEHVYFNYKMYGGK